VSLYGFLTFCAVYTLAVASPGPGVAAVVARSLARGMRGAPAFIAGFLVGDLVWFTAAATGLAALAQTAYTVFLVVKYAGAAYLLYLAYKLWTAPAQPMGEEPVESSQSPFKLFLGSLSLTLGNPKTMIFFLALLPTVVKLETLTVPAFLEIAAGIVVLLPVILGGYAFVAARARRFFRNPRAIKMVNRSTGAVMASAAVAVATR
jgi:threonine/homoserine/homoserine lactone efflux protein